MKSGIAAGNEKMEHMLAELWNGLSLGVQSTVERNTLVPMKNTEQSTKQWRRGEASEGNEISYLSEVWKTC